MRQRVGAPRNFLPRSAVDTMVSPVRCAISRGLAAAALVLAAAALAAPAAHAGQVVWVAAARGGGGALLAANDDGTYPHQLLSAGSTGLEAMAPGRHDRRPGHLPAGRYERRLHATR